MKIPTLLGIALIITLVASIGLYYYQNSPDKKPQIEVNNLQAVNVFDTSVTLIWETTTPTTGTVTYGESDNLNLKAGDNRDRFDPKPRITHFITLNNLKPNTTYHYQIYNNSIPLEQKQKFKTVNIPQSEELNFSFIKPLKGTILNTNLNPIDESLIFLEIPGAQSLATFSSTAGNFILPLRTVLNKDLDQVFFIPDDTPATLKLKKGALQSEVKIIISEDTVNLPPVAIGNNLDLVNFKPQPKTQISFDTNTQINLDFNNDDKINSLDLAILRGRASSSTLLDIEEQKQFDINSDGIVDQKDVNAFSQALTN